MQPSMITGLKYDFFFKTVIRNRVVELNPIIKDNMPENLPDLQTICAPAV
jgi:hypothetical protein